MKHEKFITLSDGRKLGFAEYGHPAGMPILYFHGTPGSRLEAGLYHKQAADNGYRLIGLDRPGMGLSSADKKSSVLSWPKDVENFADCLKLDKFSIVGGSGGAPFVAACAYAIPDRLRGAAIVSGMAPLEIPESKIGMPRQQRFMNSLAQTLPWVTPIMMKLTSMALKNPKMLSQMIKQLPEADQIQFRDPEKCKAIINSSLEAFRNSTAGPAHEINILMHPWGFNLEDIKIPVTIWHGALDTRAPLSHAKIYASLIPNSSLRIFENEGHISLMFNQIENILQEISRDPTNTDRPALEIT